MRLPFYITTTLLLAPLFTPLAALDSNPTSLEAPSIKDPKQIINTELTLLDNLIDMTKISLKSQQSIRELLLEYKKAQEEYLDKTDDKELLYRMVKTAYKLQEAIKAANLTSTFDPEFISELHLLSQIALKIGVPKG